MEGEKKQQSLVCGLCDSEIDKTNQVTLQTGCASFETAYYCSRCGRVHFSSGGKAYNRPGDALFVLTDGQQVIISKEDEEKFDRDQYLANLIAKAQSGQQTALIL